MPAQLNEAKTEVGDAAFEAAVARAYADSLSTSLRNMAAATELHGLPPDAEALLSAIRSAFGKANAVSTKAGVEFLAKRENEARAAEEEWKTYFDALRHEAKTSRNGPRGRRDGRSLAMDCNVAPISTDEAEDGLQNLLRP